MKTRKLWKSAFCFFVMATMMWGTSAFGADLYVDWQKLSGPYTDIQSAIGAAAPGDVIHVADGTYSGNILVQKAVTIKSENGADHCTIDCLKQGRGVTFSGSSTSGAVLHGFTITGGNAAYGGAIFIEDKASPTISECVLTANQATYGGGIACSQSFPIISHCVMEANSASVGGGLYVRNGSDLDPSPTLVGCTISNNSANRGGGVYLITFASPSFYNCLITGNSVSQYGGGFYCQKQCAPDIIQCTVSDNTSDSLGSGIYCSSCSGSYFPLVANSIVWGNVAAGGPEIYLSNSLLDITFSAFNPGAGNSNIQVLGTSSSVAEESNIYEDPAFVGGGDYHLSPDSPCIDTGTDQIELPEFDIDGEPRVNGNAPDMGAYEFVPEVRVVQVEIDIKPGCDENKINLKAFGVLAVAVKTTNDFDAMSIDPKTVVFAGANPVWQIRWDVDRDRDKDMLFFFRIKSLNLDENSTQATLIGKTKDGQTFEGTDHVTLIKPKGKAVGWHF